MKRTDPDIEQEYAALLERHHEMLNKVCWLFSRGEPYALQELKQEVAVSIWSEFGRHRLSRFRHESKESTWLYSIAFYTALSYTRSHTLKSAPIVYSDNLAAVALSADEQHDAELLGELLGCLSDEELRWVGYYLDDYPYESVAAIEGISEAAARKRMSRIIQKLRQYSKNL